MLQTSQQLISGLFVADPWGAVLCFATILIIGIVGFLAWNSGYHTGKLEVTVSELETERDGRPVSDALRMAEARRQYYERISADPEMSTSEITIRMKMYER